MNLGHERYVKRHEPWTWALCEAPWTVDMSVMWSAMNLGHERYVKRHEPWTWALCEAPWTLDMNVMWSAMNRGHERYVKHHEPWTWALCEAPWTVDMSVMWSAMNRGHERYVKRHEPWTWALCEAPWTLDMSAMWSAMNLGHERYVKRHEPWTWALCEAPWTLDMSAMWSAMNRGHERYVKRHEPWTWALCEAPWTLDMSVMWSTMNLGHERYVKRHEPWTWALCETCTAQRMVRQILALYKLYLFFFRTSWAGSSWRHQLCVSHNYRVLYWKGCSKEFNISTPWLEIQNWQVTLPEAVSILSGLPGENQHQVDKGGSFVWLQTASTRDVHQAFTTEAWWMVCPPKPHLQDKVHSDTSKGQQRYKHNMQGLFFKVLPKTVKCATTMMSVVKKWSF